MMLELNRVGNSAIETGMGRELQHLSALRIGRMSSAIGGVIKQEEKAKAAFASGCYLNLFKWGW